MHLIIITSLDALSRNNATSQLAALSPEVPVVLHDLLDDSVVTRRIHQNDQLVERESSVLEHGCLSCTVRFDLVPVLIRLAAAGTSLAIVGLPPGTTAENAIDGIHAIARGDFTVDSVALAAQPEDVENQLWDHHTLFESGYTAVPEDGRTPGEFLMGELLFADTVLTTVSDLLPSDEELSLRGVQLIRQVAPHVRMLPALGSIAAHLGAHDDEAARARSRPGAIAVPSTSSGPFRTFEYRTDLLLHPDRFRSALGAISEGCCFVRGGVWIAGLLETEVAVFGVGPRIALSNGGPWASDPQGQWRRGTHLALTGDDIDDFEVTSLLAACALTDEELRSPLVYAPNKTSR
ncbi:GTP-binding protein [Arthrobacter sp. TB 23]|uniref:GTP-binding protein n=1 Tax=Arthrobacter sp. TB 23 TaxID=494419 RepID=UPI00036FF683|nr:GTP-binding protein [Arthrobacter sp. TB 23]